MFAVGTEGHTGDKVRVSLKGEELLTTLRIPHFHHIVAAAAYDAFAINAETYAQNESVVSFESEDLLFGIRVP